MPGPLVLLTALALAGAAVFGAGEATAHSFKVGFIAPFSGPSAAAGAAQRDGFLVATRERDSHPDEASDGHLGGLDVYLLPVDSGAGAGAVLGEVAALIERQRIEIVTGDLAPDLRATVLEAIAGTPAVFVDMASAPPPSDGTGGTGKPVFAATFEADTGTAPSAEAFKGYRAALVIDHAVRSLGGDFSDRAAVLAALRAAARP